MQVQCGLGYVLVHNMYHSIAISTWFQFHFDKSEGCSLEKEI